MKKRFPKVSLIQGVVISLLFVSSFSASAEVDFGDDAKSSMADFTNPMAPIDLITPDSKISVSLKNKPFFLKIGP